MVPLEAPYPGVYIDAFIFFQVHKCTIIWMNVHYFPNAPRMSAIGNNGLINGQKDGQTIQLHILNAPANLSGRRIKTSLFQANKYLG